MKAATARLVYRTIQGIRREPVFRRFNRLVQTQWLSEDEQRNIQLHKLKKQLIHCYENVPFYHKRFMACGFDPYGFRNPDEIKNIPTLSKKEIQTNFDKLHPPGLSQPYATETTSGSTGNPMKFLVDRSFASGFRAAMYLGHQWAGLELGAPEGRFYGMPMDFSPRCKERLKDWLMNRIRCSVFDLSDSAMYRFWGELQRFKPHYLHGYTSAIARFSDFVRRKRLAPEFRLKSVIPTAEMLGKQERSLIEETWNVPVFNEYGCSELGILASQCDHGSLHMHTSTNYLEFLPLEQTDCKLQRIVATNLDNRVMPLVRYELGDGGRDAHISCPCGRGLPSLELEDGRLSAMLMTPGGKVVSGWLFYYMFRSLLENHSAPFQFQIHQKSLRHIHVLMEKPDACTTNIESQFIEKGKSYLGDEMRFSFETVERIPLPKSGKRVHFKSDLVTRIAGNQIRPDDLTSG